MAMFFVGTYELTVDAKKRISIPHPIRSKMNCDTDGRAFYVLPGQRQNTLAIYPERYFEQTRAYIPPPEELSADGYEWRQFELSQAALLDPDSQGRVLIPDRLLKRIGADREVTLIGVQDHLELWSRAEFDAFQESKWPDYTKQRATAMSELRALNDKRRTQEADATARAT